MQTSQQINEGSADPAAMLKIIQRCSHCEEEVNKGNKYCKDCTLVANRNAMCAANKELIPNWKCQTCGI